MKLSKNILFIITLLFTSQVFGTVYENAEDESISRWKVYDNTPVGATIDNIYVQNREHNAIRFIGSGTSNGYILGNWEGKVGAWNNTQEHTINWDMKFDKNFVVYIRVKTTEGNKYIYYTENAEDRGVSNNGKYIHLGLGSSVHNGTWTTIKRNLSADLKKHMPNNELIAVNAFLLRGNGLIDNIKLINNRPNRLYGVTLDSIADIDETVEALKSFSKRTMTRIVFDKVSASEYTSALNKLVPYTDIMGQLFDSEYIKYYSMKEYKIRVNEYLDAHGDKVKLWEIGNEVNGEWSGKPNDVAEKTIAAYKEVKKRGFETALTLYYNDYSEDDGCWEYSDEKMRDWARDRLNNEIKNGIDYIFVSYYEEDCDYHRPTLLEWENVFNDLGKIFPHAKLGFGEIGTTTENKKDYLNRYYGLNIKHPKYVGGHFWWYFKQDMVPKSKSLWNTLNNQFISKTIENKWYKPKLNTSWQIQLTGKINTEHKVDVYDIDLFDTSKELIHSLHEKGKKIICYFSAGSYEDWREDAGTFPHESLGKKLDDWEGEKWLDIRNNGLKKVMIKRMDLAKEKGCDGVDPDNVDGYTNNTGFNLTFSDQLKYNKFLAREAHNRGLNIGLKNNLDQIKSLVKYFDFAVNEQCHEYNECKQLLPFITHGKPILNIEYASSYRQAVEKSKDLCINREIEKMETQILPLFLDDKFKMKCK